MRASIAVLFAIGCVTLCAGAAIEPSANAEASPQSFGNVIQNGIFEICFYLMGFFHNFLIHV